MHRFSLSIGLFCCFALAMSSQASAQVYVPHNNNAYYNNVYYNNVYSGYGGYAPAPVPSYGNYYQPHDPRLGYCLRNDCFGGGCGYPYGGGYADPYYGYGYGGYGYGGYGCNHGCGYGGTVPHHGTTVATTGLSRYIVERNGKREVLFVGTREEFLAAYPEYRDRIVTRRSRVPQELPKEAAILPAPR